MTLAEKLTILTDAAKYDVAWYLQRRRPAGRPPGQNHRGRLLPFLFRRRPVYLPAQASAHQCLRLRLPILCEPDLQ